MSAPRRWRDGVAGAALAAALLTGCGTADSTVELSPLSARLAQVDQSLVAQRFEQARRDLVALAADVKALRADGELSATRADAILDAIIALRTTLPAPAPTATPTPTPTPTPDDDRDDDPGEAPSEKSKPGSKGKKPARD